MKRCTGVKTDYAKCTQDVTLQQLKTTGSASQRLETRTEDCEHTHTHTNEELCNVHKNKRASATCLLPFIRVLDYT